MDFEQLRALDREYVIQGGARFPVDAKRGRGAILYDLSGREYLDFAGGGGTASLGAAHPRWVRAVTDQAGKLGGSPPDLYTKPSARLAEELCVRSGMSAAGFLNSGSEANEAMIMLARKYSYERYGEGRSTVLTLKGGFHGHTLAALAASDAETNQSFNPSCSSFRRAGANMEEIRAEAASDVCAVILELVQGKGVIPLPRKFVYDLAVFCAERDWLLLVDEVQTGAGRTGTLFAFQQYGILPDVVSFAGGIAGGLPLGGILTGNRCRQVLTGTGYGSTFGENPICAAAALAVLDILNEQELARIRERGDYLLTGIESLELPQITAVRGAGLMIGLELAPNWDSRETAADLAVGGLLCLTWEKGLRLLPPLIISKEEMDKGLAVLKQILGKEEEAT